MFKVKKEESMIGSDFIAIEIVEFARKNILPLLWIQAVYIWIYIVSTYVCVVYLCL